MGYTKKTGEFDDITKHDPEPILRALGYEPHPTEKGKWTNGAPSGSLSVFQAKTGDWIAKSFSEGRSYNMLSLVREKEGLSFVDAQGRARGIIGSYVPPEPDHSKAVLTSPEKSAAGTKAEQKLSIEQVEALYKRGSTEWRPGNPIPRQLMRRGVTGIPPKFAGTFRVSDGSTVRVPFYSGRTEEGNGIVGMESRRENGTKHFAKNTRTGIWFSNPVCFSFADEIVIVESMLDAISYDLMIMSRPQTSYISIRSGSEELAIAMIQEIFEKSECKLTKITISTDNDAAGMNYAHKIMRGLSDEIGAGLKVLYAAPLFGANDHNDALRIALNSDTPRTQKIRDYIARLEESAAPREYHSVAAE